MVLVLVAIVLQTWALLKHLCIQRPVARQFLRYYRWHINMTSIFAHWHVAGALMMHVHRARCLLLACVSLFDQYHSAHVFLALSAIADVDVAEGAAHLPQATWRKRCNCLGTPAGLPNLSCSIGKSLSTS